MMKPVSVGNPGAVMSTEQVVALLDQYQFRGKDEYDYQTAIETILEAAGAGVLREERLGPHDRIDFLIGSVGVEVKTKGTVPGIIRQLGRYAKSDRVDDLILASSQIRLLALPPAIHGVPITPVLLRGSVL